MTQHLVSERDDTTADLSPSKALNVSDEFDAVMERLGRITPLLRASSQANEEAGRLMPEVEQALRESGAYKIGLPVKLGGYEFSPRQQIEAIAQVSYADASTGWVLLAVQMATGTLGGWIDFDAARKFFPPTGDIALFAGQGSRPGTAVKVDGGYRLSGSWQFASGLYQASHIHTAALVEGTAEIRIFNLPKEEATLADNWDVMGLRATGSIDYTIQNIFVPEEHTYPALIRENINGGTFYRLSQHDRHRSRRLGDRRGSSNARRDAVARHQPYGLSRHRR